MFGNVHGKTPQKTKSILSLKQSTNLRESQTAWPLRILLAQNAAPFSLRRAAFSEFDGEHICDLRATVVSSRGEYTGAAQKSASGTVDALCSIGCDKGRYCQHRVSCLT